MTKANCHVICKRKNFKWPEYLPLCEYIPISFIIIHEGIKDVVVNRNRNYRANHPLIFRRCSWHKTPITLKTMQYIYHLRWTLPKVEDLCRRNKFTDHWMRCWYCSVTRPLLVFIRAAKQFRLIRFINRVLSCWGKVAKEGSKKTIQHSNI